MTGILILLFIGLVVWKANDFYQIVYDSMVERKKKLMAQQELEAKATLEREKALMEKAKTEAEKQDEALIDAILGKRKNKDDFLRSVSGRHYPFNLDYGTQKDVFKESVRKIFDSKE